MRTSSERNNVGHGRDNGPRKRNVYFWRDVGNIDWNRRDSSRSSNMERTNIHIRPDSIVRDECKLQRMHAVFVYLTTGIFIKRHII